MTTFNYKKWVTNYKQGKPLFEQTTGTQGIMASLKHCFGCVYGAFPNFCVSPSAQVGDVIYIPFWQCTGTPNQWWYSGVPSHHFFIDSFDPGVGAGQSCSLPPYFGTTTYIVTPPPSCPQINLNTTTSAGTCNPNAWPNYSTWTTQFTNTVANHPNPCNFLNNQIATWTAGLQGTGSGLNQNQKNCKLDLANQLHTQNNC